MKVLINNDELMKQVEQELASSQNIMNDETLMSWFTDDFAVRFCWSSNAIEGNTLSLDETVALVEHDVVSDGHTYTEHQEAKNLYRAIRESMVPFCKQPISEEWIKKNNRTIRGFGGEYRIEDVKVGNMIETTYVPPESALIPDLMQKYLAKVNFDADGLADLIEKVVRSHLHFERIHPFFDGNGRVGRMIMNQQLINHGLLPVAINKNSEYRQSFKRYDKNGDISQLVHVVLHGELQAIQRLQEFKKKLEQGLPLDLKQSLEEKIEAARAVCEAQSPNQTGSVKREERE